MKTIKTLLGKRIRELRKQRNMSQLQLAQLSNIDQRSLSHIECGDTFPSRALSDLSKVLDVEISSLFNFEHLDFDLNAMSGYIKSNIDKLTEPDLITIYRIVRALC